MPHSHYLIVGGGMTASAAASGIREADSNGTIAIIGSDPNPPYDRPPLSKGLWKDKSLDSIWRHTEQDRVEFHLGRTVKTVELSRKRVFDEQGTVYTFEKLLLATGGRPRRLPFEHEAIIYYRTLEDYRRLRSLVEKQPRFAVIGGGFIGSEMAAALAMNKKQVVMIFPGKSIGERTYPRDLSEFITNYYREKGVEVRAGGSVSRVQTRGDQLVVQTNQGEVLVSSVVAGIGIEPNVELARAAQLEVQNGVVVNEYLQTTNGNVYAAGDVAQFYNPALGQPIRVEHEDNANTMGRAAGRNMAGKNEPYHHLPFFYSDLFDLGYEAVGELDSRLETVSDWKTPYREGVVYYLRDGRVRGVLLWNVWGQVDAARSLIAERGPFKPAQLKGRLPAGS